MRSKNSPKGQGPTFIEAARREQLIASAIDVLAESGYAATSLASVAAHAGIAKSAVLYYFHSKTELLEAVVDHVYAAAASPLETAVEPGTDAREQLLAYVRGCVRFADEQRGRTAALAAIFANLRTGAGSLRYGAAENNPMIDFVADLLRAGQRDGSFGRFDARLMAITVRASIDALPGIFATRADLAGAEMADHLAAVFDRATAPAAREKAM